MKLTYKYLAYALNCLNRFNVLFQAEGVSSLRLLSEARHLLSNYLACVIKNEVVVAKDPLELQFDNPEKQVDDTELDVGTAAARYIREIEEDCNPTTIDCFYT